MRKGNTQYNLNSTDLEIFIHVVLCLDFIQNYNIELHWEQMNHVNYNAVHSLLHYSAEIKKIK